MRYVFLFLSVFGLLSFVSHADAQEQIRVRTGEHDEYSRLVFDWDKTVEYTLSKPQADRLVIGFKQAASIPQKAALAGEYKNFSGFTVLKEDPLSVSLNISKDSRYRAFYAGTRLVVDVYNPTSAPKRAEKKVEKKEEPKTTAKKAEPTPAKPHQEEEKKNSPPAAEPDQTVLKEPQAEPQTKTVQAKKINKNLASTPSVISLSATRAFDFAAFTLGDELWFVHDGLHSPITPEIKGPDKDKFSKLEKIPAEIADLAVGYKTVPPEGAIYTQGSGVLWRVVVAREQKRQKPVFPERGDLDEGQARGGKIIWPFTGAKKVIDFTDPITDRKIKVVLVDTAKEFSGLAQDFVDFEVLPSMAGMAIIPKVDDLEVEITPEGVEIGRPEGLALLPISSQKLAVQYGLMQKKKKEKHAKKPKDYKVLFDLQTWEMGGLSALDHNAILILCDINGLDDGAKVEGLMTIAKMYLANGHGPESMGILQLVQSLVPDMAANIEVRGLMAAARAFSSRTAQAFYELSEDDLKEYDDMSYWRAYTLADLGDWQQAIDVMPSNLDIVLNYPKYVFNRVGITMAEIALRAGDVDSAEKIFERFEDDKETLWDQQKAALMYLEGEAARQKGDINTTKNLWGSLVKGSDDLYRAKAGLAVTRLQLERGEITGKQAIDNLEHLRYAWRGDELEAQINYWLGKTYFDEKEYAKGLNILRDAATYAAGLPLSQTITAEMTDIFVDLFLSDKLKDVSPTDATALYEQFTELIPPGDKGNQVVQALAEHLVQADLLDRASKLLKHQVSHRLKGAEAHRVAVRLAAIQLLDNKPDEAMKSLDKAKEFLDGLPEESRTPSRYLELSLLRARTLSQQGRPDQALELLNDLDRLPDVNRLKADIAWSAGYWDDAAEALGDVVLDQHISLTRPLSNNDKMLLLQRAVAMSLAGDRIGLANMREKYTDVMAQTDKASTFDVITRARQSAALADRDTLMGIVAETDLFKDFLENYRKTPEEAAQ